MMRKRVYSQLSGLLSPGDTMLEDVHAFYDAQKAQRTGEPALAAAPEPAGDSTPQSQIHNMVGTCLIEKSFHTLDLRSISRVLPNCVYDQQKFAAITIRIFQPCCTVLLFTSGKMVLTGCRSFLQCVLAAHEVVRLLRRSTHGQFFRVRDVSIQNIVGNVDIGLAPGGGIDLERFHQDHSIYTTYQKNMFPGLIYRPNNSPVVLLIFSSGKVVITGGKSTADVSNGWRALWPTIRQYISVS